MPMQAPVAPENRLDDQIQVPPEVMPAWDAHPEIVKLGHPTLRKVAQPVTRYTQETHALIARMKRVMQEADGLGLAAPQVGESVRILVYEMNDKVQVLVNPVMTGQRGEQLEPKEGCLSIPGLLGEVKRYQELRVRGFDERGRPVSKKVSELEARVIQHEIDHLDGILFIDRADPATLAWQIGEDGEDEAPHD